MKFLFLGKADSRGEFTESSKSKEKKPLSSSLITPSYYSEMKSYFETDSSESVIIVSISNIKFSEVYKCDLNLTSRDLNYANFSLQLASCLTLPSSTIFIECSNLKKRGLMRLVEILKRLKALFDNSVRVILTSETGLPSEVNHICDKDFSTFESPCKKAKVLSEKKFDISEEIKDNNSCAEVKIKKLLVENERMKIGMETLIAERDKVKMEIKDVIDEKDILEAEKDGLKLTIESYKERNKEIEDIQRDNKKLLGERDY